MILFFLFGCLTGSNYPDKNAAAFCETLYQCVDAEAIETFLLYDNQEECQSQIAADITSSTDYTKWEEGETVFNKENAESCLQELQEVQSESSCNGSMDPLSLGADIYNENCFSVYE